MTIAFHFRGAELGLFNPLYHSNLEITEVYQDQSTQEEVMRLWSQMTSENVRMNPLYGAMTTANERYTG